MIRIIFIIIFRELYDTNIDLKISCCLFMNRIIIWVVLTRCVLTATFIFFLGKILSFPAIICHIFPCRVNFVVRKKY